ncbi:60S ribosomal protein L37a [Pteropus alecto]|uniref:60S ribosomal protein L37a n=1 Tax=Pteropus alecto TaxID=9402 RepID=L5KB62_PTEAL|nr:60S ribosomal protein L37a [Pteropus alecto]
MVKKIEIGRHTKYTCSFCVKTQMKRRAVGVRPWAFCMRTVAAGAWTEHHFCPQQWKVCHQKTEGIERPVEAP